MPQKISDLILAGTAETDPLQISIIAPRWKRGSRQGDPPTHYATCAWGAALYCHNKAATIYGGPAELMLLSDDMATACGVDIHAILPVSFFDEPEVKRYWRDFHNDRPWNCRIQELVYGLNDHIQMSRPLIAELLKRHGY